MSSHFVSNVRAWLRLVLFVAGLSLIAIASVSPQSTGDPGRVAGWRSDISYYLGQMKRQHYIYSKRPLPAGLVEAADRLSRNVPRYSDERILAEFEHLASFAGDGHTYMLPFGSKRVVAHMLPLRFYLFSDGLYVIDAFAGYEQWIGSRVLRIGDTPTEVVIDRLRRALSVDNRYGYRWVGPALLGFRGYLENFADGIGADRVTLTLKTTATPATRQRFPTVTAPPFRGIPKLMGSRIKGAGSPPIYLSRVGDNFWFRPLADSVLYFQFNQVRDAPNESLADFARRFGNTVESTRPTAIIVDVRHNNGGNLDLLPPLMNVFRRYESDRRDGSIYVLTGRNTFSAAQVFINQMDRDTRAIFAGEPSSSKPNFVGEEAEVMLPWSGAIGSISNRYHESIPGDNREWIEPEIRFSLSAADYFANRDPLLDKVLAAAGKVRITVTRGF